jgi:hypothetical protein
MKGIDTGSQVFLEEIPKETYLKICKIARQIGKQDHTFRATTEYFGKNPNRCTNLTYFVRDGCPDFCGQVNREIPEGISIHFHDFFYVSVLERIGIHIEKGDKFHLREIKAK